MEDDSQELPAEEAEVQEEEQSDPTEAGAETAEPSEAAPDSGEPTQEQKVSFTPEQQEVFDKAIAKKTFKAREAERRAEAAEKRAAELEAQIPRDGRPTVPPMPDPYDADYEAKVSKRDQALREAAAYDAKQEAAEEQKREAQRQRQQAEQDELYRNAIAYNERTKQYGLKPEDAQSAAEAVAQFGISKELTQFILKDEQGPLLTTYLARNPVVLEQMQSMSPIELGAHIASEIKPKLATVMTRTKAPEPAVVLDGGGSPKPERGPKGASFE